MNKIWMIEGRYWDEYNRYQDSSIDSDEGFFTSKEDADARATVLNGGLRKRYEESLTSKQQQAIKDERQYDRLLKEYEVLKAAGINPVGGKPFKPKKRYDTVSFEEYVKQRQLTTYESVEISLAPGN